MTRQLKVEVGKKLKAETARKKAEAEAEKLETRKVVVRKWTTVLSFVHGISFLGHCLLFGHRLPSLVDFGRQFVRHHIPFLHVSIPFDRLVLYSCSLTLPFISLGLYWRSSRKAPGAEQCKVEDAKRKVGDEKRKPGIR